MQNPVNGHNHLILTCVPAVELQCPLIGVVLMPNIAQHEGRMNHDHFVQHHLPISFSVTPSCPHLPLSTQR
jgi:hypothetical protein